MTDSYSGGGGEGGVRHESSDCDMAEYPPMTPFLMDGETVVPQADKQAPAIPYYRAFEEIRNLRSPVNPIHTTNISNVKM